MPDKSSNAPSSIVYSATRDDDEDDDFFFVVRLTDEKVLALFPARTILRDPHHR